MKNETKGPVVGSNGQTNPSSFIFSEKVAKGVSRQGIADFILFLETVIEYITQHYSKTELVLQVIFRLENNNINRLCFI